MCASRGREAVLVREAMVVGGSASGCDGGGGVVRRCEVEALCLWAHLILCKALSTTLLPPALPQAHHNHHHRHHHRTNAAKLLLYPTTTATPHHTLQGHR
ncbi:hypothetical protein E2C01_050020 [Portunus trituberculatus]|uniref:Uncharacterized protein n=1 Tax=Portunus trituberculatus TaxID=210409 RepID=A0A5B7G757_PORTR|nr:hypothetical protein [Portunus trituberculatus]